MMAIARMLPGMAVFYNGPRCGASAPDHMHFQAVPAHRLPLFADWIPNGSAPVLYHRFSASTEHMAVAEMRRVLALTGYGGVGEEPMMNVYARMDGMGRGVEFVVVPRRAHRPGCYGTGEGRMLVSPAAIECAGVMITPRREDFERMDFNMLNRIYGEVCHAYL